MSNTAKAKVQNSKEKYQKLTQLEHVLLRPDTYIGSVEPHEQDMWVQDADAGLNFRKTKYTPGLFKIVDEIIVNAADNKWKWNEDNTNKDSDEAEKSMKTSENIYKMDMIKVTVDAESNTISVWNNGYGIPVRIHATEGVYIPELIFGNLLTSSNYNDDEKKFTGGRNGYGAKLTNIYSTEFTIETGDTIHKKLYKQTWKNSMSVKGEPKISDYKKGDDFTCVTFKPDLGRFHMDHLDKDIVGLIRRRVYDLAGTLPGVKVFLNGEQILKRAKPKELESSFKQYVEMYLNAGWGDSAAKASVAKKNAAAAEAKKGDSTDADSQDSVKEDESQSPTSGSSGTGSSGKEVAKPAAAKPKIIYEKIGDWSSRTSQVWEVAFSVTEGQFEQVSFVNAVATTKGGTHVNYVVESIVSGIMASLSKKKNAGAKSAQVKAYVGIFINCRIYNPTFDSQTKDFMTLPMSKWASRPTLSDSFFKKVLSSDIVSRVERFVAFKADEAMAKKDTRDRRYRPMIASLEDANKAGTNEGHKCTLIICEGESAKAWAISGLKYVNRDYYGIFPIRGKLINVRDASHDQIMKNKEISNIKQALGLRHNVEYNDEKERKTLRYGSLMIMTDQDHDGSHIKGLLINFLDHLFSSLLKLPNFLVEFITPIVKAQKGREKFSFFTMPEYEAWKNDHNNGHGWKIKYYKGLGTNQKEDAEEYFTDLARHRIPFKPIETEERELVDMAFNKKRAEHRRDWLGKFVPGTYLDQNVMNPLPINEFINKELILFSMADNARSIPNIMDGLKPGQRKVIFGCFKRKLKGEIKVAQLQGYVSEHAAYHHGEMSLQSTIVALAQRFVGTNNINLLEPRGTFGSRQKGGKDAAAARYIFTTLSPITRILFNELDDPLLSYLNDDGLSVEPLWYAPSVPTLLINGSDGIGTGWSSTIPQYHPLDVVKNLRHCMHGRMDQMETIHPWYRGFFGSIATNTSTTSSSSYVTRGKVEKVYRADGTLDTLVISELPIGTWSDPFKEWIQTYYADRDCTKLDKKKDKDDDSSGTSSATRKKEYLVYDIKNYSDDDDVHFRLELTEAGQQKFEAMSEEELIKFLKLETFLSVSNLVCFDPEGRIHKYATVNDIIKEFYAVRLGMYERRKQYHLNVLKNVVLLHNNKARFAKMLHEKTIELRALPVAKAAELLAELGFDRFTKSGEYIGPAIDPKNHAHVRPPTSTGTQSADADTADAADSEDDDEAPEPIVKDYLYLLDMPQRTATKEYVARLLRQAAEKEQEYRVLDSKSAVDLWEEDLVKFEKEWNHLIDEDVKHRESMRQRAAAQAEKDAKAPKKRTRAPAKPRAKAVKADPESQQVKSEVGIDHLKVSEAARAKAREKAAAIENPDPELSAFFTPKTQNFPMKGEENLDLFSEVSAKPAKPAPATTKPRPRASVPPAKPAILDISDDSDDEVVPVSRKRGASANGTAPKRQRKISKTEDDDDDDYKPE